MYGQSNRQTDRQAEENYCKLSKLTKLPKELELLPLEVIHVVHLVDGYGLTIISDKWRLDIDAITGVAVH